MSNSHSIIARAAAKGLKLTDQRRLVAKILEEATDHPDVEELYNRAVAIDKNISIPTVYRIVKQFEEIGIIEKHDFKEGRARYEVLSEKHHDHMVNVKTGEIIEFESEEIEKLQHLIAKKHGFRLVDHRLELYVVPLNDGN
jgi:Fur family transcriptional regulator, ferric uptake regulator